MPNSTYYLGTALMRVGLKLQGPLQRLYGGDLPVKANFVVRIDAPARGVSALRGNGIFTTDTTVVDCGCRLGREVRFLQEQRVAQPGCGPHHRPDAVVEAADVVNLGFVLNVIDDLEE